MASHYELDEAELAEVQADLRAEQESSPHDFMIGKPVRPAVDQQAAGLVGVEVVLTEADRSRP